MGHRKKGLWKLLVSSILIYSMTFAHVSVAYAELYMSISGTVKDAATGKGIAGVEMIVNREYAPPEKAQFTTTDSNGNFTIKFLPPGDYNVFTHSPAGYVVSNRPLKITLMKGKNIVGLDIQLPKAGSVSGKVYQKDVITPLKGASVGVYTTDDNVVFGTTNDRGEYMISGLKETNSGTVVLLPDGYAGVYKQNILITQEQTTQGINFTIAPDLTTGVNGTVKAQDGSSIANALVLFYGEKGGGKATTDSAGRFSVLGLAPGIYAAKVIAKGYQVLDQSNIQVFDKNLTTVNFSINPQIAGLHDLQQNIHLSSFDLTDHENLIVLTGVDSKPSCDLVETMCGDAIFTPCALYFALRLMHPVAIATAILGCYATSVAVCRTHVENAKRCNACQ